MPFNTEYFFELFNTLDSDQAARWDWITRAITNARGPVPPIDSYPSIRGSQGLDWLPSTLPVRPKVFVSYHHRRDRVFYEEFCRVFADTYDVCHDDSVDREIDSDDSEYVIRRIRKDYLTGTSCTIVLCGAQTRWRKFVDWEIKATLDKQHGLIGVNLPNNPRDAWGCVHKPDRLQDNIDAGYAVWLDWSGLLIDGPSVLRAALQRARLAPRAYIRNGRGLRDRNG